MRAIDIAIGQLLGYLLAGVLLMAGASYITGVNFFSLARSLLNLVRRVCRKIIDA